jgi:hypothetical protein
MLQLKVQAEQTIGQTKQIILETNQNFESHDHKHQNI